VRTPVVLVYEAEAIGVAVALLAADVPDDEGLLDLAKAHPRG
jgi:hypothetical protein